MMQESSDTTEKDGSRRRWMNGWKNEWMNGRVRRNLKSVIFFYVYIYIYISLHIHKKALNVKQPFTEQTVTWGSSRREVQAQEWVASHQCTSLKQ